MYVYSTKGVPVGFVQGAIIHDLEGRPAGRIVGSRVHRFDGSYVGEFFKDMVVERPDARPCTMPAATVPARQPAPVGGDRRRAVIDYGYPDSFHLLGTAEAAPQALAPDAAERPREPASPQPAPQLQPAPAARSIESDPVLVVDDEPKVRETIRHALNELGFRVEEAGSGKEAVEMLESSRPQLVILDFLMPDMDGAEVARAVRKMDPDLPIVFSTGHSALRALRNAAGSEIAVLPKPFTVSELDDFLSETLAEARGPSLAA